MIRTQVFAHAPEIEELKELLARARSTPVIAFSTAHALERGGLSGEAWQALKERCQAIALAHGLEEIPGFYGCDLATGEFVREG